jgi:DNA-binding transcriptional regulator YdaS (Cro superfamily)
MKTKLKTYLDDNGISYRQLASDLGLHRVYINSVVNGLSTPGARLAADIVRWSKGEVTFCDLRPDLCGDEKAAA